MILPSPCLTIVLLLSLPARADDPAANAATLVLQDSVRRPAQVIAPAESVQVALPPLPARPDQALLLRLRAVCQAPGPAGCNFHLALRINDVPLGRFTDAGEERLVGRGVVFQLRDRSVGQFDVVSADALMTMFAPDLQTADAMTSDGLGGTFCLDISDVARGGDGNTLTIRNTLAHRPGAGAGDLLTSEIEVGWFDRQAIPAPLHEVPQRGAIADRVEAGGLRLSQARGGGFAVGVAPEVELLVETAVGVPPDTPAALVAEDPPPATALPAAPLIEKWGPVGYRITAQWPALQLVRSIEIRNGLIAWNERWTNTGDRTLGVPFHHRVFLRGEPGRCWLAGAQENQSLAATSQNPTLYLDSRRHPGSGAGITAESDWLRLLMATRTRGGVAELYSDTLALAPGCCVDFALSIAPVRDGGYWGFINGVRSRWGLNGLPLRSPVFFYHARANDAADARERAQRSLGHLGPVMVGKSVPCHLLRQCGKTRLISCHVGNPCVRGTILPSSRPDLLRETSQLAQSTTRSGMAPWRLSPPVARRTVAREQGKHQL